MTSTTIYYCIQYCIKHSSDYSAWFDTTSRYNTEEACESALDRYIKQDNYLYRITKVTIEHSYDRKVTTQEYGCAYCYNLGTKASV
jgi:hypothetical protein